MRKTNTGKAVELDLTSARQALTAGRSGVGSGRGVNMAISMAGFSLSFSAAVAKDGTVRSRRTPYS
jgi:hypothetical protein